MESCIPILEEVPEENDSSPDSASPCMSEHGELGGGKESKSSVLNNNARQLHVELSRVQSAEYSVTTRAGSSPLITAVAVCEEKNAPWKRDMEDATVFIEKYGGREGSHFFGVFDGFHGRSSAESTSRELPVLVLEQLAKLDASFSLEPGEADFLSRIDALFQREGQAPAPETRKSLGRDEQLGLAFTDAFSRMDRLLGLGRNETSKIRWSGCTALVCLICGDPSEAKESGAESEGSRTPAPLDSPGGRIHIANCGNVHAVLYKNGKSFRLTKDHSTSNPKERKRILRAGGAISVNKQHGLVEGLTRATRGLGNYGDRKLKKSVIPVPFTASLSMDPSFQLLILASSGLWDALDENVVATVALELIQSCQETPGRSTVMQERSDSQDEEAGTSSHCPEHPEREAEEQLGEEDTERRETAALPQQHRDLPMEEDPASSPSESRINYEDLAARICRELVGTAVAAGSRENISVTVVFLQGLEVFCAKTLTKEV